MDYIRAETESPSFSYSAYKSFNINHNLSVFCFFFPGYLFLRVFGVDVVVFVVVLLVSLFVL